MPTKELIDTYIREAAEKRLWGYLQIDFQDGQPVLIRKEETIKLNRVENNRRCQPQSSY